MKKLFLLLLLFPFLLGCSQKEKEFTVLQWNIWQMIMNAVPTSIISISFPK